MELFKKLLEIEVLLKRQHVLSKEILTIEEVADYLNLSKSAIYKMTSRKELPFYNPGGKKIYFKRSDIENWVFSNKSSSVDEFENEISSYLSRTQNIKS